VFVFWKLVFEKSLSKLSYVCLSLEKLINKKTFSGQRKTLFGQRKIWLGFQESVFLLFWPENTFWKL
jgi:hypothetical protein